MNKFFIRGLLMVALVLGTLGSISSCKDNVEDLRVDLERNHLTLQEDYQKKIDALRDALNQRIDSLKNLPNGPCTCQPSDPCTCDLKPLQEKLDSLEKIVLSSDTSIIKRLIKVEELMKSVLGTWTPESGYTIPDIHQMAVMNQTKIDSLFRLAKNDSVRIDKLTEALKDNIAQLRKEAEENLAAARKYTDDAIAGLRTEMTTMISDLREELEPRIQALEEKYADLEERVAQNEEDIKELQERLDALENRVENMVTSVVVQAVENPIFGSFALPINVQSNLLLAYYGECTLADIGFPQQVLNNEYNGEEIITEDDWSRIKTPDNLSRGYGDPIYTETAGKVYLTINPNNVDFTKEGKTLSLVNSLDEKSGIELTNLQKSEKLLTFGFTRANNGFYEADAKLDPEKIATVKVNIDENLKSAVKGVIKEHSKQDFAQLIKAIYDQFNGILPANAVKAEWNVDGQDYAVYSNYNIAATAFKPLSFKFLYGKEFNIKFPTIDPISIPNIDLNEYIDFSDIKMPQIEIGDINVSIELGDVKIDDLGQLYVVVKVPETDENGNVKITKDEEGNDIIKMVEDTVYVSEEQMKDFANKIAKQLGGQMEDKVKAAMEDAMKQVSEKIQKAVDDAMTGPNGIITQIQDKLSSLNKTLNDKIRGNFGAYVDKLNNYINKVNNFTNRISHLLSNPNHYLQVTMLYELNGEYHQLSNNKNIPTYAKLAGGNAIEFYPTTYTAEIVAPAYKKYVAVTNVTDANGNSVQSLIDEANNQEYMNTVIDGNRLAVALSVPASAAGCTYEIVYSALDYHGITSTQKYYVKVVK
ncbi:MAG: hypothetical protein J1F10_03965 [Muribaculaceae bacterium]|nr:hypothetical protein [Muribaculaceae bacterium]